MNMLLARGDGYGLLAAQDAGGAGESSGRKNIDIE